MTFLILVACGLSALVVHEAGHYLAAQVFGIRTKRFKIDRRGIAIVRERGPWFDSMVVAAAGPLLNLAFAAAFPNHYFRVANLCIGLINLVPVQGSDGCHILECIGRIENARHDRILRAGQVDEMQFQETLYRLAAKPDHLYLTVKTPRDAEKLYERLFYAGADMSRVTISAENGVAA